MKKRIKQGLLILLAVAVSFTMAPLIPGSGTAEAAGVIGKLNNNTYTSLEDLADDLKSDYKNKKVTIEMTGNWNAAGSDDFDRRLVIPAGCSATLKMHGFVYNRNRAFRNNSTTNGELICVEDRASLTIIGGDSNVFIDDKKTKTENDREHPLVATYSSTNSDKKADKSITTKGGTLTGGCDSWGSGGIQMHEYSSVTLNYVTIAGCSTRGSGTWSGLGGGIYMADDYGKVTMNNSTITGCFADVDGGGIYANGEPETIELNHSFIDRNYAEENGGGFYTNNQTINISGLNGSEITDNEAGGYGGGVCLWYGDSSISGFKIEGNKAKYGAGVHLDSTGLSLSDLQITGNSSSSNGGGVFVHKGKNTITSCVIKNNYARGDGGGVFVDDNGINEKFGVTGKTIIKDNNAKGMGNQFHISSSNPEKTRVNFNLIKGAEVWVSYANLGSRNSVMVTEGKVADTIKSPNCIKYLHPSNGGWHFAYNSNPSNRKIYYVRNGHDDTSPGGSGEPYDPPDDPVNVNPKDAIYNPGKTTDKNKTWAGVMSDKVGPGGEGSGDYALIRGFTRHEETDSDSNDSAVAFYYSDAFFDESVSPYKYNDHLATASLNMAYAGMYLRAQEDPDKRDPSGNYYYNRHAGARQFMADIGCPDQTIYVNESNEKKPQTDSIGVTIASKELAKLGSDGKPDPTGYILLPIVVRGGGYELEWASNATLDKATDTADRGKEAKGFSSAADQVEKEIDNYIKQYGLEDELKEGKIRFWIAGYSRAGATANLTAKRLVEKYASNTSAEGKNNKVFAYTCEAPMGGADTAEKLSDKTKYYCIHNMINAADLVPHVAPQLMGFKRYGVDHYIPGKNEGAVKSIDKIAGKANRMEDAQPGQGIKRGGASGIGSAITYSDNDIAYIKNNQGDEHIKKMVQQLEYIDSGIIFDDYFHPMAIKFISIPPVNIYEEGNYAHNHAEAFIPDFMRFLQEGMDPNDINDATQAVQNRDMFAHDLQPALRETLALVMTMDSESSAGTIGRISTIMSKFSGITGKIAMAEIYAKIVRGWSDRTESEKRSYYTLFWNIIKSTGALDFLSESDVSRMEKNWPALANLVFTLLNADYRYNPEKYNYSDAWAGGADGTNMFLGTFATFSGYILQSHYPEVNLAWARAYDSYYTGETKEYETLYQSRAYNDGYRVAAPTATGKKRVVTQEGETEEPVKLIDGKTTTLYGDQKIILENENIVGEAVYYDLVDDKGTMLATNQLYRGGVDLSLEKDSSKTYKLTTYDISYGVRSYRAIYEIKLLNDKHMVSVDNGSSEGWKNVYYREGDKVTISASPVDKRFFKEWRIRVQKPKNDPIGDTITEDFLGEDKKNPVVTFTLPKVGDEYRDQDGIVKTYPEGYMLEAYAQTGSRVKRIEIPPFDKPSPKPSFKPVAGEPLAESTVVNLHPYEDNSFIPKDEGSEILYPITWTYTYKDPDTGETKTVHTSGEAYRDTVYTASITIPQDTAKNIAFFATKDLEGYTWDENKGKVYISDVTRNDVDGSATVKMQFKTGSDGGVEPPEADIILTVNTFDLNLGQPRSVTEEYHVKQGAEVELTAPYVTSEQFSGWDFGDSGVEPAEGYGPKHRKIKVKIPDNLQTTSLTITALYIPYINEVTAVLQPTEAGQPMQTEPAEETLKVKVYNEYEIHPDFVTIEWSPDPLDRGGKQIADYLTAYTATIRVETKKDDDGKEYIMARKAGTDDYQRMAALFSYSDQTAVTVNGAPASVIMEEGTFSYTFPMSKYILQSMDTPDDINGVEHGAADEEILKLLPKTIRLMTEDGSVFDWPVTWTLSDADHKDEQKRDAITRTASAAFEYKKDFFDKVFDDPNGVLKNPVQVKININEAEHAQPPAADLLSGMFFFDQQTMLTTEEEGGSIYYTVDGSDPRDADNQNRYKYPNGTKDDDGIIEISRDKATEQDKDGKKMFVLTAYTQKDRKWDSAPVTYTYVFDDEFPVPAGYDLVYNQEEQTGVSSSSIFEIANVSDGAEVKEGSAVATNAGTYDVTLTINDGYKWIVYHYEKTSDTQVDPDKVYYKKSGDKEDYVIVPPEELDPKEEYGKDPVEVNPAANGWFEKKKELTTDDQTVTFIIHPMELSEVAQVSAKGSFKTLDDLMNAFKVNPLDDRELLEGRDYEITYGEVKGGKVTVTVQGKGNYTGSIVSTYIIDEEDQKTYTITLDLNGGELNGLTGVIFEECYENTSYKLPKPSREGYKFDYWKGSRYEAGEKYKVKEDHTFVAQWQKTGDAAGSTSGDSSESSGGASDSDTRTGDEMNLLMWLALLTLSLLGILSIAIAMRKAYK